MRAHVLFFCVWRYSSTHSQRGTRRRGGVNCTPRPHYPRGKKPEPARKFWRRKKFLALTEFRTPDPPPTTLLWLTVLSLSLSYTHTHTHKYLSGLTLKRHYSKGSKGHSSRVLEKLTFPWLVKKIPRILRNPNVHYRVHNSSHLSLS